MIKRVITLIGVVLIGIIIGVTVVVQQAKTPVLQEILKQQDSIPSAQKSLESRMFPPEGPVFLDKQGNPVDNDSLSVNNVQ